MALGSMVAAALSLLIGSSGGYDDLNGTGTVGDMAPDTLSSFLRRLHTRTGVISGISERVDSVMATS